MYNQNPKDILSENYQGQVELPNATASLVLGILSLISCILYGILAIILGIIGLVLAQKDKNRLRLQPYLYTNKSISNMKAGWICSLIGLILGSVYFLSVVVGIFVFAVSRH